MCTRGCLTHTSGPCSVQTDTAAAVSARSVYYSGVCRRLLVGTHVDALLPGSRGVRLRAQFGCCPSVCMSLCHSVCVDFPSQTCYRPRADSAAKALALLRGCVPRDPGRSHFPPLPVPVQSEILRYAESAQSDGTGSTRIAQSNYITSQSWGVAVSAQN